MVINKFPNREVYEKIKAKGSLDANDVNVLEDYPGLEWKGEYSSTAIYATGDIVYYDNMLYVMASPSVIGAIPGIDDDWIDFAKRSVTSSDVTNALGFTPADSTKVLPLSGGTLTGNLTGKYITGTWLQATDAGHLATTPTKIPVFDDKGWIYYRTPAEILKDIGASSGYTLTEADKTEIAGKVTADGLEFTLADLPAGGSSGSCSGGALKAMSTVSGYIGIPAADLPENGVVWMCFGSGDSTELYTGTVTIQDAGIAVNDMLVITNGIVNQLNQVSLVSDGLAIYGLSTNDYRGVWQQVGAGGASGTDLSLGMISAAVGQIAKITAVDTNSVPTAWEPVDMAGGGGYGEIVTADETILASGTIATGTVKNTYINTGVTLAELRNWKHWTVEVKSAGQTTYWGVGFNEKRICRVQHSNIKFQIEWIDSAKTVARVFYASGTGYEYGADDILNNVINSAMPVAHKQGAYAKVTATDDSTLNIDMFNDLTVDALWRIKGVLRYGD